jgi:hypothetical protein
MGIGQVKMMPGAIVIFKFKEYPGSIMVIRIIPGIVPGKIKLQLNKTGARH